MNNIERYIEKDCEATNIIDLITSDKDFLEAFTPLLLQDRELLNMTYQKATSLKKMYEKETTLVRKRISYSLEEFRKNTCIAGEYERLSYKYNKAKELLSEVYEEVEIIENIEIKEPIYKLSKCSDVVTKIDDTCKFIKQKGHR